MLDRDRLADLAVLLDWYREMGADEAVGETAIDWLARGNVAPGHGFQTASSPKAAATQPARMPRDPAPVLLQPRLHCARRPPRSQRGISRQRRPTRP